MIRQIAVVGSGSWGTALAINLAKKADIQFVVRSHEAAREMTETRANEAYLPGAQFPSAVTITADFEEAVRKSDLVLIATPTSAFESVLGQFAAVKKDVPLLWGCKGFCPKSGEPLSVGATQLLGASACFGVFSGPSFAAGLAKEDPTAVVVATNRDHRTTMRLAKALSNNSLRVYGNSDLIGVQICGAIKNIYAIAAGVIDGCGWGENTRAAMLTRAVNEARRYLKAYNAKHSTLMGLSGFGDIYLTCSSRLSRNYQIGMALANHEPLDDAIKRLGHVAEGVPTSRLIHQRALELGIDMPIVDAVNAVLSGEKTPLECVASLMGRDIKHEKSSA